MRLCILIEFLRWYVPRKLRRAPQWEAVEAGGCAPPIWVKKR